MPQVPYNPVPTAQPTERGPTGFHVQTPGAAFGENIGLAMQGLGKMEQHVGDELFSRAREMQTLNNETEAKEADAKYIIEAGKLHANFNALEGINRVQAFDKYQQDLQESRQRIRAGLSNDMARKMFDSQALGTMSRSIFNGAGAAAAANKEYRDGTAKALIKASWDQVYSSPDDATRDATLKTTEDNIRALGRQKGWSPEQTDQELRDGKAAALGHWIQGKSRNEPIAAREALDKYGKDLGKEYDKTEYIVNNQYRDVAARNIAKNVMGDAFETEDPTKPPQTLESYLRQAEAQAKADSRNDPKLVDAARHETEALYRRRMYSAADFQNRQMDVMTEALLGKPGGARPTNMDDLKAVDPRVSSTLDNLSPTNRTKVERALLQNSRITAADRAAYENSPEGRAEYQRIYGMVARGSTDIAKEDFINTKFGDATTKYFLRKQKDIEQGKEDKTFNDARKAHSELAGRFPSEMAELGIYDRARNKDTYDRFMGGLAQEIDRYKEAGKPIDRKALDAIYYNLIREVTLKTKTDFMGVPGEDTQTERRFLFAPTGEFIESMKARARERGQPNPESSEIERAWGIYLLKQGMQKK